MAQNEIEDFHDLGKHPTLKFISIKGNPVRRCPVKGVWANICKRKRANRIMAKKTRWGRIAKLTELSAKVSSSYLGQRVASVFQKDEEREESLKSTHLKNAERIVDTMGILKGAAMKVGQSIGCYGRQYGYAR